MGSSPQEPLSLALRYWSYFLLSLLAGAFIIHQTGIDRRDVGGSRIYFEVTHFDTIHILLQLLFLFIALWLMSKPISNHSFLDHFTHKPSLWIAGIAAFVIAGFYGIVHAYPFAPDEWAIIFQSHIFQEGFWHYPLPEKFHPFAEALTPTMILWNPAQQSWNSFYLPVHTLLFTGFESLKLGWALNPLLTAGTGLLLLQIHDKLWPDRRATRGWIILFLAASPQVLCMAMSYFPMTCHLFFNVLWLRIYLETGKKKWFLLPISFLAFGLHNPVVHSLFIAPFLIRWFWEIPKGTSRIFLTGFFVLSLSFWIFLWKYSNPLFERHTAMLAFPDALTLVHQTCHAILSVSWAFPVIGVGLTLFVIQRQKIPPLFQDLAYGLILTFAFYFCFKFSHGRGWGFRYAHGVIHNALLLAILGFYSLQSFDFSHLKRMIVVAFALTFAATYPLKFAEMRFEIRPFENADQNLNEFKNEFVILSPSDAWYSNDILRNEPTLSRRPLRLNEEKLTREQTDLLIQSGQAIRITPEFYQKNGIPLLK